VFSENTISGNDLGFQISIDNSKFFHNNIINNNVQAACSGLDNIWDNGYPSGGNYWSDYNETDSYSGPYQNETTSDGIGDAPYIIDAGNRDNYPFMSPWVPPPDIEIVSVKASKNVVGQGFSLCMNVTVANLGSEAEGFNMSVFWNTTVVQTQYITLAAGKSATVIFQLNSTGWMKGNHTIWAYAWPVPGEVDTVGNNLTGGWVVIAMIGDITGPVGFPDGKIDVRDVAGICSLYGFKYPDPRYANWDITGPTLGLADGKIDARDVSLVSSRYGQKDP
jgi:hypothetical protein